MNIRPTPLNDLLLIERSPVSDKRGFLSRIYCEREFIMLGLSHPIVQINHTLTSQKGAVRGLHFQFPPHAEKKMVTCIRGEIFDVAVDLRKNSSTFMCWHSEILSDSNHSSMLIPEGFAHGFQALSNDCELLYLHTKFYCPESEGALNVKDPVLGINWPVGITDISDRDLNHPLISDEFGGISL